ncbi:hypothetical protein DEDE109153_10090 [Deinococcus deserti]|uniref:Uncharacterized protein n=1 Tax=Deinococcus deserti (strain DSM 17065 / CIP 109153 / LMG 22923 / VCD115) TaxID=546414 RepID=C1CZY1_DEIDV|nr:hypothetical protein [Deinococcus deserti]ACO45233.1 hypothetical protein Deide_04070 [Deinococcus deserti VCD115]
MLNAALSELLDFFSPLSAVQRQEGGAVTLLTPGTNVLGLNATYLPDLYLPDLKAAALPENDQQAIHQPSGILENVSAWHAAHSLPVLLATSQPVDHARLAISLHVGTVALNGQPESGVVVEQVSRLHVAGWAHILATARGTPEWGADLAHHLGRVLEGNRDFVLLQAYQDGEPAGALLWRATAVGGATHLWGALTPEAGPALLEAAAHLGGGQVTTSAPTGDAVHLEGTLPVWFSVLHWNSDAAPAICRM